MGKSNTSMFRTTQNETSRTDQSTSDLNSKLENKGNIPENKKKKIDPQTTLHIYDKNARKFLFYSKDFSKIYSITPPFFSIFPYDGGFPTRYHLNQVFFCGGHDETQLLRCTFLLDIIKGTFTKKQDMNYERRFHILEEVDHKIMAIGGKTTEKETNTCEAYNPNTDFWDIIPSMNYPRVSAISFALNNDVCYVVGGNFLNQEENSMEKICFKDFDMKWNLIKYKNSTNYKIPGNCANSCEIGNNKFLIFGGYSENNLIS